MKDDDLRGREVYTGSRGKDMYDELRSFRKKDLKKYIVVSIIVFFICIFFSFFLPRYYFGYDIPVWASLLIALVLMILCLVCGGIKDFKFSSVDELKTAMVRSGYDEARVNLDFMTGRNHNLVRGMINIGKDYFVIYSQTLCYVGAVEKIKNVEVSDVKSLEDNKYAKGRFVTIIEDHRIALTCADTKSYEGVIADFRSLGINIINV